MGGWLSWPPPPSLVMHSLHECNAKSISGEASSEEDEQTDQKIDQKETPEEAEGGWVRIRDINDPRIHTLQLQRQRGTGFAP